MTRGQLSPFIEVVRSGTLAGRWSCRGLAGPAREGLGRMGVVAAVSLAVTEEWKRAMRLEALRANATVRGLLADASIHDGRRAVVRLRGAGADLEEPHRQGSQRAPVPSRRTLPRARRIRSALKLLRRRHALPRGHRRELCYRLYASRERTRRIAESLGYNALVRGWPEVAPLDREGAGSGSVPTGLFTKTEE